MNEYLVVFRRTASVDKVRRKGGGKVGGQSCGCVDGVRTRKITVSGNGTWNSERHSEERAEAQVQVRYLRYGEVRRSNTRLECCAAPQNAQGKRRRGKKKTDDG